MVNPSTTLDQALTLARRLPTDELARLSHAILQDLLVALQRGGTSMVDADTFDELAALAAEVHGLAHQPEATQRGETTREPLPAITSGHWSADLPLRREELYDDDGRA